ncbi:class I SAM-dependent methyltransferase [Marinobacter sp.]|uniref:class I SAM-dependent methyltransferase n=1 Tax=Marinobacter sp. TaxID=50741 RepID=UPI002B2723CC|nr:class I SAM-dependent methyltransferase [Marinobacter sp.]
MSSLPNTHEVLLRNDHLLDGRVAILGLSDPSVLSQCPSAGLAMTEHAGVFKSMASYTDWQLCFGYDSEGLQTGAFDTVIVFLPKARAELSLRLAMAQFLGRQGASLVMIGEKKEGIAGGSKQFLQAVPDGMKVDSARHCQVWNGTNSQPKDVFALEDYLEWTSLTCAGIEVSVAGLPGVFSEGELDGGTRLLLENLAEKPLTGDKVLDFACGAGVIGTWLQAHRRSEDNEPGVVDGVDVQAQAVACARATYERAGAQGDIYAEDGLAGLKGRWQAVVTNPPFHSGVKTDTSMTEQFIRQVARHLVPGGELRLVANSFLPYEALLQRFIGPVQTLAQDKRFTVYRAFQRLPR